jgi:type IV secretory pathway VirJ component
VFCIYGEEDAAESLCADPAMNSYSKWVTSGGHHFDVQYSRIGQRILDAFNRSAATP